MDYRSIIESKYNRESWLALLHDIFKSGTNFRTVPIAVDANSNIASSAVQLGTITLADDNKIAVYEIKLSDSVDIVANRVGIRNLLISDWKMKGCVGAFMFCFRDNESVLRFSYVSSSFQFTEEGKLEKSETDTKRYTYLLGAGHRSRTAIKQFEDLKNSKLMLADLTKAFSIEALSDRFFKDYKDIYEDIIEHVTGKRIIKVANKWEEKVMHKPDEIIMNEFSWFDDPEKAVRDYVKKLMGRIVFLQFIQKKGWLGVPVGKDWGEGDKEFLQNLYDRSENKDNFIDGTLEFLFNDINTKRDNDLAHFVVGRDIKVPYLNGGLFEQDKADNCTFRLPKKLMDKMFLFFSSYNFTIDENDPDDAEIGVDPEMLGRIFENLLEDNKDKGAFYTPKEIVQYMCRESLIAYLQTGKNEEEKQAIREFVITYRTNVLSDGLKSDIDQKLKDVKICDPAIGSGAFPMGLLKELFACRCAVETLSNDTAAEIKKHIIQNNIYGVDIEKGAVDIARLRFWLALIVDEKTPHALPNMDFKIMQGNSLIPTFNGKYVNLSDKLRHVNSSKIRDAKKILYECQSKFYDAEGDEKKELLVKIKYQILEIVKLQMDYEYRAEVERSAQMLDLFNTEIRKVVIDDEKASIIGQCIRLQQQLQNTSKSLNEKAEISIPFFDWKIMFSDVFNENANNGFDIVIGNPPYGLINKKQNQGEGIIVPDEILEVYKNLETYADARGGMLNIFRLFVIQGGRLLKQQGVFCEIFPLAFACDLSASKLRKHVMNNYHIINIEAFPERDNPKKRVFASAKVSVCILTFSKTGNVNEAFSLRINREPFVEEYKEKSFYTPEQIQCIDATNCTIPLTELVDSALLVKIFSKSIPFSHFGKCYTGEIDMTFCKKAFTSNPSDCKILRGAHVDRYIERTEISQGEVFYINSAELKKIKKNLDQSLFTGSRIIMQGITGVNEKTRLKMTLVDNTYCANSVNYCQFSDIFEAKYHLSLFNSKLLNYVFKLLSTNSNVNGYEVDNLPIVKNVSIHEKEHLVELVSRVLSMKHDNIEADISEIENEINTSIYQIYGLTKEEISIIER